MGQIVANFILGIIDHFITDIYMRFDERQLVNEVQNIIKKFPQKFNSNLGGFLRSSFCGGREVGITHFLSKIR